MGLLIWLRLGSMLRESRTRHGSQPGDTAEAVTFVLLALVTLLAVIPALSWLFWYQTIVRMTRFRSHGAIAAVVVVAAAVPCWFIYGPAGVYVWLLASGVTGFSLYVREVTE